MYVCVPCVCLVPTEAKRGCGIHQRYRCCEVPCECWESDLDSLEEQSVLLSTEPPLQLFPFDCSYNWLFRVNAHSQSRQGLSTWPQHAK